MNKHIRTITMKMPALAQGDRLALKEFLIDILIAIEELFGRQNGEDEP